MKARQFDGNIVTYPQLPNTWNGKSGYILNFRNASETVLKAEGFYDVVQPTYNSLTQNIGGIEWDSKKKVFTRIVTDIDFPLSLAEMKAEKKDAVKKLANKDLSLTDWYVTRKADIGTAIPEDINTQRKEIRDKVAERETEIDGLNTKKKVAQWNVILFDIPEFPIV